MKSNIKLLAIILPIFLSVNLFSQGLQGKSMTQKECCAKTLMMGLKSDNRGLTAGCVYMLGEVCCKKSVICLMDVLHSNPCEELRILAALSLYKIHDSRGLFAVKQAIRFDKSERVRRLCEKFYRASLTGDHVSTVNVTLK